MHLQESGEMYLETIYRLSGELKYVRSIDVAEEMGYSKPSVSRAVSLLRQGGYLLMDEHGHLTLTPVGVEIAEKIFAHIAPLLRTDHHHHLTVEAGKTTDDSFIICKTAVAVKFHKISKDPGNVVQCVRAFRMTRQLHALPA